MEEQLPCEPERPLDSDCCGQGCVPCVLDLYEEEVKVWEAECRRILSGEKITTASTDESHQVQVEQLSLSEYRSFPVEAVTMETQDTYRYRLTLQPGARLGLTPGQHIVIRETHGREYITRQYTPVSDVDATSYFELLIKVYKEGRMSGCVRDWQVGSQIQARGPYGSLSYTPNQYGKVYMLAVGTGIAPMVGVVRGVLNNAGDETRLELLYGCRTYRDILMKAEIDEWARYWNFSATYFLSQESSGGQTNYKYGEKIRPNRITMATLQEVISPPRDNILVLICGTKTFEKHMIQCVQDLGLSKEQYHKF